MGSNMISEAAVLIVPLVVAIVFHEVAHGWVARWRGDPTAAALDRLSFTPLRHVDPVGTVILPLGLALSGAPVFGWAKPVPVDARRLRNPRTDMMLVALAGPGMNLVLATAAALALALLHAGGVPPDGPVAFGAAMLVQFVAINVFLALFNLLPVPPFDGGHVVQGLLPPRLGAEYAKLARYGFLVMVLLLVVLPMLSPHASVVSRLVMPPAHWLSGHILHLAGALG